MNMLFAYAALIRCGWHYAWARYLQAATSAQIFGRGDAFTVDLDALRAHQIGYQLAVARYNELVKQ